MIDVNGEWLAAPEQSVAAKDGNPVEMELSNSKPYILKFVAPGHRPVYTFLNAGFKAAEFNVQLSPSTPTQELNPTLRGNFNNFDGRSAIEMEQTPDGLWEATIETDLDTIQYVVNGVHLLERVPGTEDRIVINESAGGFHRNFISEIIKPSEENRITITFDPSEYSAEPGEYSLALSGDKELEGVAKLYSRSIDEHLDRLKSNQLKYAAGNTPPFEHDYSDYLSDIQEIEQQYSDSSPVISLAAELVKYRFRRELSSSDFKNINLFKELAPDSPLWMLSYGSVTAMSNKYSFEETEAYLKSIAEKSPFELLKGEALFNLIRNYRDLEDEENWHAAFFELVSKYPDHYTVKHAYQNYAPEQPISEGRPLPFEEFNRLDGTGTFNINDLEEDYVLLDFWATWCGPCIASMPKLHELHDKYSDKGFSIVSISLDDEADLVHSFRNEWEMPWVHGIESINSSKIREMGVAGVPYYILLGPDRNVLNYNQDELRSEKLTDIIGSYLE
ncbi:TlpA disulfide reductase family protein [Rhodohalobacter sp.]|uniref:TlpA family protein disulfide reductase n=1 Tax=Rhodohalobacter sp. TaxID=1974210 RepID=UPI002ACDEAD3|nr:TlpA disulfide reductase family protein [Rhodohalobacter sp.]MDZ7757995.1 TlpA disulfide reductase family protein [Rhodohalobacter sp.]